MAGLRTKGRSSANQNNLSSANLGVAELTQMASKNDAANIERLVATITKNKGAALGSGVKNALTAMSDRRALFIMCSGMHTTDVQDLIKRVCEGTIRGPGVAFVAPALYEGIPSFLTKIGDIMGDMATYSALYMGLVSTAGFTGFKPVTIDPQSTEAYYNGVFASMFLHSTVVIIAIIYRLAASGHLRDSDKLLFLWRARYVPLLSFVLFSFGSCSAAYCLMNSVSGTVATGSGCFEDDPTLDYPLWWNQWTGYNNPPVGQGIVHPKGEVIKNPWMIKAEELGIELPDTSKDGYHYEFWYEYEGASAQYHEFMMDHFGLAQPCINQIALIMNFGKRFSGKGEILFQICMPYLLCCFVGVFWLTLWIAPNRHVFNYWAKGSSKGCKHYCLGSLGFFSFHFFGPLSARKVNDPYDMTEAFEEYQLRGKVGEVLASKDKNGNGFVDLVEHRCNSVGVILPREEADEDEEIFAKNIALLKSAKLDAQVIAEFANDPQTLYQMLGDAGVKSPGERGKIIAAVRKSLLGAGTVHGLSEYFPDYSL